MKKMINFTMRTLCYGLLTIGVVCSIAAINFVFA